MQDLTEIDVGDAAEVGDFEYLCFVFDLEDHFGGWMLDWYVKIAGESFAFAFLIYMTGWLYL